MERYSPTLLDLAPRDIVARSIQTEVFDGKGIRGDRKIDDYVHLDATHLGADVLAAKLPDITGFCKTYLGINPADQPILYLALTSPSLPLYELDEYGQTMMAQRISTISLAMRHSPIRNDRPGYPARPTD